MGNKTIVSGLALSAAAFVALITSEGWEPVAKAPIEGDRPTVGFGSTFHADGEAVKEGETISPVDAVKLTQTHIAKVEQQFKNSLPNVEITQGEYDVYIDFVYQYGIGTWLTSSMRRNLLYGDRLTACDSLLLYKYAKKRDCSIRSNGCYGVWVRQKKRHTDCVAAVE